MVAVLWMILAGMGVFAEINGIVGQVGAGRPAARSTSWTSSASAGCVSLSIVIGVIDVILMTAIATLGAFLYNIARAPWSAACSSRSPTTDLRTLDGIRAVLSAGAVVG